MQLLAKELNAQQYEAFIAERIVDCKLPITDTLSQSDLVLFHTHFNHFLKHYNKRKIVKIFISHVQSRESYLELFKKLTYIFFMPSLGMLRIGSKSGLLPCLEALNYNDTSDYLSDVTVRILMELPFQTRRSLIS